MHCACGERAARLEVLRSVLSFSFQRCHFHCDCNWSTTIFDLIELCTFISFLPLLLAVWSRRARDRILFDWALRFHSISAMAHRNHNASGNATNRLKAQSPIKSNTVARLAQSPYKSQRKKARHQMRAQGPINSNAPARPPQPQLNRHTRRVMAARSAIHWNTAARRTRKPAQERRRFPNFLAAHP